MGELRESTWQSTHSYGEVEPPQFWCLFPSDVAPCHVLAVVIDVSMDRQMCYILDEQGPARGRQLGDAVC